MESLNLPNLLTCLRVLAVPFCVYAMFKDGGNNSNWQWIAWLGFMLVGLTDFFDGRLARARGQITAFGTFLDPVADKVAIGAATISLSLLHRLYWWVTAVILIREIAVTLLRLTVIKDRVIPASKGGKLKTLLQGFGVSFYVLPIPNHPAVWHLLRDSWMAAAIVVTLFTGFDYFAKVARGES
jgi:CDP-diacylglycerol--glycerol-3-phosphate 3-phosphatidyltransferase